MIFYTLIYVLNFFLFVNEREVIHHLNLVYENQRDEMDFRIYC